MEVARGPVIVPAADVVVVGAGLAGLSAATRLAAAGRRVVVVEEAPRLGGRATAFVDRESGERVDNGQHVLFGCYTETYRFLRVIGADHLAPLDRRLSLTLADGQGRAFALTCPPLPSPWHLAAAILRWRALPVGDRLGILRLVPLLVHARRAGPAAAAARVPPRQTVAGWLTAMGQSPRLCRWLWHPLALAALNQPAEVASAAPFVRVLAGLFGPGANDSAIGVPTVPLDELYAEPARRFIESRGGRVLLRARARVVLDGDGRVAAVLANSDRIDSRAVISSVPWHALARLWDGAPPASLDDVLRHAAALESSPIVTVNLWLDGPVGTTRFVGLVDGPMHWVFDKSAIFGQRAGHLSVVASGAGDLVRLDNQQVIDLALAHVRAGLPAARTRRVRRAVVVREHRATFSLAPGSPPRPGTSTPVPGFHLAGDWTDTGLPGTIESAVVSGHAAADAAAGQTGR